MSNIHQLSCLEDLPDEIFLYELFPLFSLENLYYTFSHLNQRLNKILQSCKPLKFIVNTTNNHHPALEFFTPYISHLTVCLGQFDINSFVSIRSLILQYPSLQQRNLIRPENFPQLKYLSLSYPLEDSILLNLIFSNAFQYLKSCKFDRVLVNHTWTGSSNLRSLSISVHDSYGIICILHACPNISRLRIIVYDTPQNDLPLPRYSISCMNLSLQYLFIRSTFEILTEILKVTPNLKWLTFNDIKINLGQETILGFDFKRLTDILVKLHHLSYLYFEISILDWNGYIPPRHTLHPLFKHIRHIKSRCLMISSDSHVDIRSF